ncbi:hypothetical protein [Streptomyces sp. NBC_01264]|uniref:hypothetical protein n=1 Tax=Streptomyces sp. NBC_01264 TaxID=2903804 RepID=UPI0022577AFD|nr:hypothetical protein [Streptomyces sp. NBC_01264]MCX4775469.1 hypothetical protein [Streptomyces sp. NBC_01264]
MTTLQALFRLQLPRVPYDGWRRRDAFVQDTILALALTVPAFVPNFSHIGGQIGDLPQGHSRRPSSLISGLDKVSPKTATKWS